jgi:hypothetical protein
VVTPAEPLPLPPGEKGKAPVPVITTPMVVDDEEEDEEEDLQPLSRRTREPPGKILGQGMSREKREAEKIDALAAPTPKRRRSTAGHAATRRATGIPTDSEETVSDHEALATTPTTSTGEGGAARNVPDEVPAVVNPDLPAVKKPVLESIEEEAPEGEPAASAMAACSAEGEARGEAPEKTQAPRKKFRIKSVLVKKISP